MARETLIHVPELLSNAFGYPRSTARAMIALGNVTLDGEKLNVNDMDMPPMALVGKTLRCAKYTAILLGDLVDYPMVTPSSEPNEEMVMGGQ